MNTLEDKRAYNREKARKWRAENADRMREIRRDSARRARSSPGYVYKYIPRLAEEGFRAISVWGDSYTLRSTRLDKPIECELCQSCGRKYLTKLYCLWCTKK